MTTQLTSPGTSMGSSSIKASREAYLASLLEARRDLSVENAELRSRLQDIRERAAHEVHSLLFPSMSNEEWRFTDLSPLLGLNFQAPQPAVTVTLDKVSMFLLPEALGSRLVFVDGHYAEELSSLVDIDADVMVSNLAHADTLSHLTSYLDKQEGLERTFTTLNTASFSDGAVVCVGKNAVVRSPIHILFVSTASGSPTLSHPRCLVIAQANSQVTLIEDYVSLDEATAENDIYFTNSVTEIWADENSYVNHTRLQRDCSSAFHIGKTAVSQAKSSHYACHAVSSGAKLFRHNLEVFQTGEDTETILNGLAIVSGEQVADTHSLINYTQPHGTSRQLYKSIVDDRGHSIFNGKVNVPQAAQLTDASQLNRNLLLSPKGRVDTKPQLEIVADNVKCTHGATVSQLDADEVFYLQSRGIDADRAQNLLIYAFAAELIQHLPLKSLQEYWSKSVETMIGSLPSSG